MSTVPPRIFRNGTVEVNRVSDEHYPCVLRGIECWTTPKPDEALRWLSTFDSVVLPAHLIWLERKLREWSAIM